MFFDPCIYCQQMLIHELKITREKKKWEGGMTLKSKEKVKKKTFPKTIHMRLIPSRDDGTVGIAFQIKIIRVLYTTNTQQAM